MSESTRIALEPGDYWRIKAKLARVQQMRAELRAAVLERQAAIDAVATDGQRDYDVTAEKYGFDPKAEWTWDDETTSLSREPKAVT